MDNQLLHMLSERVQRLPDTLADFANDLDACLALGSHPKYPEQAFIKARHVVEHLTRLLCSQYQVEWNPHNLNGTLDKLDRTSIPREILAILHNARIWGNNPAHRRSEEDRKEKLERVKPDDIAVVVMQLLRALEWYFCERPPAQLSTIYENQPLLFRDRVLAFFRQFHERYHPYVSQAKALTDPALVYIETRCKIDGDSGEERPDALKWVLEGMRHAGSQLLLADYGMGKSFLALQLFLNLAREYERDPDDARVPVLFPLRRHRLSQNQPDLIIEDLYEFLLAQSFPIFYLKDLTDLLAHGRLVLIFDGIDEIPLVQTLENPLDVLSRLDMQKYGPCPWVATSRRGLFARILSRLDDFGSLRTAQMMNWDRSQWTTYVEACDHHLGLFNPVPDEESRQKTARQLREDFLSQIDSNPRLQQLTVTPLYARMLVESHKEIIDQKDISVVDLYQTYATLVLSGREDVTLLRDMSFRFECLESLAVYLFENGANACTAGELFKFANKYVHTVGQEQLLSFVGTELQTYSLLNCDAMGLLSFSHKSFYEYFLARALLKQIKANNWQWPGHLFEHRIETGELEFLAAFLDRPEHRTLMEQLESMGGGKPLNPHIVIRRNLISLKMAARHSLAGVNMEDLDLSGLSFSKADLHGACLDSVRAPGGDFSYAQMKECSLVSANLERCNLSGADLTGAILDYCTLTGLEQHLPPPRLCGASLEGVTIRKQDYNYLFTAVMMSPDAEPAWQETAIEQLKNGVLE